MSSETSEQQLWSAAVAAYLASGHKGRSALSQQEIAVLKLPGLTSQAAVSRALERASGRGYLVREAPTLVEDQLRKDGQLVEVERFASMHALQDSIARLEKRWKWEPKVEIVRVSSGKSGTDVERQRQAKEFANRAAVVVRRLLGSSWNIGVSWGQTVSYTVAAMEAHTPGRGGAEEEKRVVVPLVGEPPAGLTTEFSSTLLAERLLRALSGKTTPEARPSLRFVPSFLTDAVLKYFQADAPSIARQRAFEYYALVSDHREIFIAKGAAGKPTVEELDAVVTSLSVDGRPWGSTASADEQPSQGRRKPGPRKQVAHPYMIPDSHVMLGVAKVAVGDICGVLLPKHSEDSATTERDEFQARWTGINSSQLRAIAQRGSRSRANAPGVVVVANEPTKVKTVLAALRLGYVSHLIISEHLALELHRLIQVEQD